MPWEAGRDSSCQQEGMLQCSCRCPHGGNLYSASSSNFHPLSHLLFRAKFLGWAVSMSFFPLPHFPLIPPCIKSRSCPTLGWNCTYDLLALKSSWTHLSVLMEWLLTCNNTQTLRNVIGTFTPVKINLFLNSLFHWRKSNPSPYWDFLHTSWVM